MGGSPAVFNMRSTPFLCRRKNKGTESNHWCKRCTLVPSCGQRMLVSGVYPTSLSSWLLKLKVYLLNRLLNPAMSQHLKSNVQQLWGRTFWTLDVSVDTPAWRHPPLPPHTPVSSSQSPQFFLSWLWGGGILQDPLNLVLNFPRGKQSTGVVHPQPEKAPLVVDCHKLTVLPVLYDICREQKKSIQSSRTLSIEHALHKCEKVCLQRGAAEYRRGAIGFLLHFFL